MNIHEPTGFSYYKEPKKENLIYYIQEQTPGLDWENTPSQSITFKDRAAAAQFCRDLSKYLGTEIRLTSEVSDNGAYFSNRR